MVAFGALLAPIAIPVLPPETYIRYTEALHLQQPRLERHKLGPLPQIFADQFGWEEMAATVARVYNGLPPDVRARTAIFGQNYGQAGAIDLFGGKYGLPHAISGHQSYFLWGPGGYTGESIIVMAGQQKDLESRFAEVQKVASVTHPYSMPSEHFDVFYCRGTQAAPGRDLAGAEELGLRPLNRGATESRSASAVRLRRRSRCPDRPPAPERQAPIARFTRPPGWAIPAVARLRARLASWVLLFLEQHRTNQSCKRNSPVSAVSQAVNRWREARTERWTKSATEGAGAIRTIPSGHVDSFAVQSS